MPRIYAVNDEIKPKIIIQTYVIEVREKRGSKAITYRYEVPESDVFLARELAYQKLLEYREARKDNQHSDYDATDEGLKLSMEFSHIDRKAADNKAGKIERFYLITGKKISPLEKCLAGDREVVLLNLAGYYGFEIVNVECEGREYLAVKQNQHIEL
jgi:hypothetical protein